MRGGRREGAGRKAPDGARVTLSVRVLPETRDALMAAKRGSLGQLVDEIVREYVHQPKR